MAMVMLFNGWDRPGQGRPAMETNGTLDEGPTESPRDQLFLKSEKRTARVKVLEIPARCSCEKP